MRFELKRLTQERLASIIGMIFTLTVFVPLFVLGEDCIISIHDQLDISITDNMLLAKHIGSAHFSEFMNGAANVAGASPGTVLFYIALDPIWAFLLNWLFVALIAFWGMFSCLQELFQKPWLSLTVAILFSQLPFYSTLELSVMGVPLPFLFCIRAYKEKSNKLDYLLIAFFAIFSSPVYSGYVICLFIGISMVYLFCRKHPKWKSILFGLAELCILYLLLNPSLLAMLFPGGKISNRAEYIASSLPVKSAFTNMLENGQYHAVSLHYAIFMAVCLCFSICLLQFGNHDTTWRRHFVMFIVIVITAVFIAIFYAIFHSPKVVSIRNALGGIFTSVQLDRFYFLYPCIWYLLLGYILYFISSIKLKCEKVAAAIRFGLAALLIFQVGSTIYNSSQIRTNLKKFFQPEKVSSMSWNEFFSPDLFSEIEQYIGRDLSTYRVASIGIFPSIALYNDFYCIDGYACDYDLSYKHAFRKIIENELEKNNEMRSYYDDWGNRCYIFVDQIYGQYLITKDQKGRLDEIDLDTEQMKKMGCEYILSALPIESPFISNITFLNDFSSENSPYHIYLYRIEE